MSKISVILTAWKRNSIQEQLERLGKQTLKDDCTIYVWQNESHIDLSALQQQYQFHHISASKNFKFHGRFTLPLLFDSQYTVILDDDTLPNSKWLEKCVSLCSDKNCIVGGNGRIVHPQTHLYDEMCVDDPAQDIEVDYVGHCWFFKTEWIKHFWSFSQPTFQTGEDISFCAALKIAAGIRSFVSGKSNLEEVGDSDRRKYGTDSNSSYTIESGRIRRDVIFPWWRSRGWKLVMERTT
jgi:hypothetical protein